MSEFKRLTDSMFVAGQLTPDDIATARDAGFTGIVNNRPDGEAADQPTGAEIEAAANAAGIAYRAVPVGSAGFSMPQVEAMSEATGASAKTLAFCRTGTRSTLLWAMAQAKEGRDPDEIARDAAQAGYDIAPVRTTLDMLAGKAGA